MENLIFKAIIGSQSYGTATPTSDIDYKGFNTDMKCRNIQFVLNEITTDSLINASSTWK